MEVTPFDGNFDSDGFTEDSRVYAEGTFVSVTAPLLSNGRKFVRWSMDGTLLPFGLRTIEIVAAEQEVRLRAIYQSPRHVIPDHPIEDDGDLE